MAQAIVTAWREQDGDILGFLPGVREIERVRERLEKRLPDALLLPLHGQVEPAAQRAAMRGRILANVHKLFHQDAAVRAWSTLLQELAAPLTEGCKDEL